MQPNSLIHQIFDQAFNQGDLTIVDELVAVDSVTHTLNWGIPSSRLEIKQMIAILRTAFPDLHCYVEGEIGEADLRVAHWTMYGTHLGLYLGNRPTRRSIEVQGFFLARIAYGQIVENWILFDELRVLQQLGLVPL